MTPLEEIEQAIEYVRASGEATPLQNIDLLGPPYQARAIERLEATVRAIGVMWRERLPPKLYQEMSPATGHKFEMGDAPLRCLHCGLRREAHSR